MESYGELKDVKELLHHDCKFCCSAKTVSLIDTNILDLAKDEAPKAQPAKVWGKPAQPAQAAPVKSLLESR